MSRIWVFRVVMVVLALAITSNTLIQRGPFLGLDFQNMDAFHDCYARDNPYLATGDVCGDYLGRHMFYPPLLYWAFAWTRLVTFEVGYLIWATAIILGSIAALAAWVPANRRDGPMLLFGGLLFLMLPMLFTLERGNNDVIVLALWTVSAWLLMKGRPAWAGLIAGLAVMMKLYPAFAVVVVLAGLLSLPRGEGWLRWPVVRYSLGGIIAALLVGLPSLGQSLDYARTTLPLLMDSSPGPSLGQHTLTYIAPGGQPWILTVPLLATWTLASYRRFADDPTLVLTGALAISTFFSGLSVDYNLITTYPFLIVLFARATAARPNLAGAGLLVVGLVAVFGHRAFYQIAGNETGTLAQNWLQWAWLMAAGITVAWSRVSPEADRTDRSTVSPTGRPDPAGVRP